MSKPRDWWALENQMSPVPCEGFIHVREVTAQDEAKTLRAAVEYFKKVNPHLAKDSYFHTPEKSMTVAAFLAGVRFANSDPEGNTNE